MTRRGYPCIYTNSRSPQHKPPSCAYIRVLVDGETWTQASPHPLLYQHGASVAINQQGSSLFCSERLHHYMILHWFLPKFEPLVILRPLLPRSPTVWSPVGQRDGTIARIVPLCLVTIAHGLRSRLAWVGLIRSWRRSRRRGLFEVVWHAGGVAVLGGRRHRGS